MKKAICVVLIFTLLFTIAACGNSKAKQSLDEKPEVSVSGTVWADAKLEQAGKPGTENETEMKVESGAEKGTEIGKGESSQGSTEQEATQMKMKIKVENKVFTATLAENSSVDALKKLLADGSLTLNMSDYANMEKGADLGVTLPQNNIHMNTQAGDIILYQGRTFVIYYDTNSWSLTPIGKIDNVNAKELRAALGTGDVTVVLSIE